MAIGNIAVDQHGRRLVGVAPRLSILLFRLACASDRRPETVAERLVSLASSPSFTLLATGPIAFAGLALLSSIQMVIPSARMVCRP